MTQTDRIAGLQASVAIKAPCRVATTANITLSGLQTVDGVALAAGDRVLVKDQTDAKENGIYVAATTPWSRAKDFNGARDVVQGTILAITSGTTHGGEFFKVTAGTIVFGATDITFESIGGTLVTPVAINEGGTGAGTADGALSNLGGTTVGKDLFTAADAAAVRTALGLVIGTDVQADLAVPSQAEAEAGTATTERAWTAERVGQAVAALAPTFSPDHQVFTSSGTWTKPGSGNVALIQCWAGGGSGGTSTNTDGAGGGGGGGYASAVVALGALGATESVTIGAGGAAVSAGGTSGNTGGNTTFGSLLTAYGGGGGGSTNRGGGGGGGINAAGGTSTSNTGADGGGIGAGSGGTTGNPGGDTSSALGSGGGGGLNNSGGYGYWGGGGGGGGGNEVSTRSGGNSHAGGGGGGGGIGSLGGVRPGGTSLQGGAGGAGAGSSDTATSGAQPGGGGGGARLGTSGAGGDGQCTVTVW